MRSIFRRLDSWAGNLLDAFADFNDGHPVVGKLFLLFAVYGFGVAVWQVV